MEESLTRFLWNIVLVSIYREFTVYVDIVKHLFDYLPYIYSTIEFNFECKWIFYFLYRFAGICYAIEGPNKWRIFLSIRKWKSLDVNVHSIYRCINDCTHCSFPLAITKSASSISRLRAQSTNMVCDTAIHILYI